MSRATRVEYPGALYRPSNVARRLGVSPAGITKSVARVAKGERLTAETVLRVQSIGWGWEKKTKNRV